MESLSNEYEVDTPDLINQNSMTTTPPLSQVPKMGLKEEAYNVLREDLLKVRPDLASREVILCPICLREISKEEIIATGIEHIIPQVSVKSDPDAYKTLANKNQRCGITVLCRQARAIKATAQVSKDGCNGFKGKTYDWSLKTLLDDQVHTPSELRFRHETCS